MAANDDTSIRDFCTMVDGRVAMIYNNDSCGGVFRGSAVVWFGEVRDGKPVVRHVPLNVAKGPTKPIMEE